MEHLGFLHFISREQMNYELDREYKWKLKGENVNKIAAKYKVRSSKFSYSDTVVTDGLSYK